VSMRRGREQHTHVKAAWEHLHAAALDGHNRDVGGGHPRVRGELRLESCSEGGGEGGVVKRRDVQLGEARDGGGGVGERGGVVGAVCGPPQKTPT
jgi:hypothetical protein